MSRSQDAAEVEQLRGWVRWIGTCQPDPCRYDHHGYCQSHNLDERPCPMEGIHAYLNLDEGAYQ